MSAPVERAEPASPTPAADPSARPRRARRWAVWIGAALAAGLALLVLLAVGARVAIRTEPGRRLVAHLLDGLPLGAVGRLHVEGLAGDPLSDLKLARLQIVDARGPWLDARDLEMRWRYGELLTHRFHALAVTARSVVLLRAPVLAAQPPSRGAANLPVAIQVDALRTRLETLPAFSATRGLYAVDGGFTLERNMAAQGRLSAQSRLHAGDGLSAVFQLGEQGRVLIRADATEGRGGAIAGTLGLPADEALAVRMRADGSLDAGELHLGARTGADTPLAADAHWAAGRTHLTARLELGASRLTRGLAARAGPVAQLTLAARHLHGDLFDVQGSLAAQTAELHVAGPLDWKVRSTSGLDLALQVPDAKRWWPDLGAARLDGVLAGDPARFAFKGRLAAQRLVQGGYALDQVSGPVALDLQSKGRQGRVWSVQADLAGAGGRGTGLSPALLGVAPRVKLDATRLADGRLLIRSLDVRGAGLALTGQGGQALLGGGLSFKGQAELTDLAAVQKGIKGRLDAAWTADEAKGAADWRFSLDAHAAGLATGVPTADHFLGAGPRLKADAAWGPAGLQVASAALTGAAAQATLAGRLDPKGAMAFTLGWQAQGPFQAGPLSVAGRASGTGRIGGSLSAPTAELDSQVASLALGRLIVTPARLSLSLAKAGPALSGQVALTGPSAYGPASMKAGFQVEGGAIQVRDLTADAGGLKASGSASLQNGTPSAADLTLQLRPGAFISAGRVAASVRLVQAAGGLNAHLAVEGAEIAAPGAPGVVHSLKLDADGPLDHLPLQLSADGAASSWRFAGSGKLDSVGAAHQLTLTGAGAVRRIGFSTLRPAVLQVDGDTHQADLDLMVGGGHAQVKARQSGDGVNVSGRLTGVDLSTLEPDYAGAISATLSLAGKGSNLTGGLDANLSGARSRDAPANLALDAHVRADLAGSLLRIAATASNAQGLKSQLQAELPAVASAAPLRLAIDRTRPLRGDVSADGELRPLWDLLVGGDQRLSGHISTHAALAGTLNAPKITGHAAISKGRYQNYAVGLDLQQFAVDADFDRDRVRVVQVSGVDGRGGSLSGSGDIGLAKGGGSSFAMKLKHFRVIDNDTATATMSGDVTVTRDARGHARLAGALKVDRADISPSAPTSSNVVAMDVVEINKPGQGAPEPSAPSPAPKASAALPLTLDVAVRASRGVFVKGKGLNVELSLDAHVTGSASAPDLSGEAKVVLGSYDFAGKRFDFDTSSVVHLASSPQDIRLNLLAKRQDTTLTAEVHVTGTAARPEIKLSSEPVLPQDEVLSQVLFGSSAAQLTGAQAAELASTLASLSGGGGFDVLGRLRQFAGLDRLAFGQGASGTGVSGGKYVTDAIYVELTGGGREGPSAAVEWRVRRNFSVISRVGTQGDAQLSIQYNTTFK